MLASSPSPSAALRPASSSSPSAAHSHSLPRSSSHIPSQQSSAAPPLPHHSPAAAPLGHHYEPVRSSSAVPPNSQFSPRTSRVAIEELRSALTRHTVDSSPHGPSGDLPRGRMPAGLTSLGGSGSNPIGSHSGDSTNDSAHFNFIPNPNSNPIPSTNTTSRSSTGSNPLPHPSDGPSTTATTAASSISSGVPAAPIPAAPVPAQSVPPSSVPPPMPARTNSGSNKRNSRDELISSAALSAQPGSSDLEGSQSKRLRPSKPAVKLLPRDYEQADPRDIVVLISSMLMELIRFNDKIPLHQGRLTRFHSRSPPRISVQDYLQRLTTHATLSPPILLSMVCYIDRLCALYPAFNVSSLTIHRFLIASTTVASKGLSDSFWTNKTYARVGGVSLTELALLELEFLFRVEWRIVPQPEVLVDYYQSLVERCEGYEIVRN